tara:strand:- start:186 stop:389 length:204 start_codon:yes stop_codon:yes gene_type:complete
MSKAKDIKNTDIAMKDVVCILPKYAGHHNSSLFSEEGRNIKPTIRSITVKTQNLIDIETANLGALEK